MILSRFGWIMLLLFVGLLALVAAMIRIQPAPSGSGEGIGDEQTLFERFGPARQVRVPPGAIPRMVVPVAGVGASAIHDSWGDARAAGQRAHHGTDIMAPGGTPVLAAGPGRIEKLHLSEAGGITLYVRSPDRRWSYYYAHLAGYARGMAEGREVRQGELIGYVGDTGNAGAGNTHLHFGLTYTRPDDAWYGGEPVNPYPLLARARPAR